MQNPVCRTHCIDPGIGGGSERARAWRNQVHFTGGATRGQALFKGGGGQQFNDIISNNVII